MGGEFVERFRGDDRAVHVREQQLLAAARGVLRDHVHGLAFERAARRGVRLLGRQAVEGNVRGLVGRKPVRRAGTGSDAEQRGADLGYGACGERPGGRDECQHMRHAAGTMPRGRA